MVEPRRLTTAELDAALADLGRRLAPPPAPDLARSVRARIAASPPARLDPRPGWRRWLPAWPEWLSAAPAGRWATGTLLALLAVIAVFAALPSAREAVADRLGLRGVRIFFVDELPAPTPQPVARGLGLGHRVSLDEARAAATFPLAIPTAEGFDDPGEIYQSPMHSGMISFVYPAGDDLPASTFSGVGALLTQFAGTTNEDFIAKGLMGKAIDGAGSLELVDVAGARGYWLEGPHGFFLYTDPNGEIQQEAVRLAGNVLLWEREGVTYRLEAEIDREQALAIAASMRPLDSADD